MNGVYQYCLLRYVHSQFLGEAVNAGILFYFPDEDRTIFKYPNSLDRLKKLYRDFPEKLVRSYLSSFANSASKFSAKKPLFSVKKLENILPEYFIVPDGSALFFDKINTGVKYKNAEVIANDLFKRYFAYSLEENAPIEERHNESYIIHKFNNLIKSKDGDIVHYLRGETKIQTPKALLRVDQHWKNGTINLVKAVSFDLKEEGDILHKAAQLFGTFNFLNEELSRKNYKLDILFSAPQNPNLSSVYQNAIDVVSTSTAKKEIYTEEKIDTYVSKVLQEIERKSLDDTENDIPF